MESLLTCKEICKRVKLSRPTLIRWEKEGKFPKRRVLGNKTIRWVESEINEWIRSKAGHHLDIVEKA